MKKKTNIAVIIPCYKVKNNILFVVKKCLKYFNFVICVDDNCPEKSGFFISKKFKSNKKVKVLFHKYNKGVGGAVKSGYRFLLNKNFDHIIKLDGDNQMDPSEYKNLIKPMYDKKICYTKGNRFLDNKYFSKSPKIRFYGNYILTIVSKLFIGNFKMGDPLNGYICINNKTLKKLKLSNIRDDFFFETSMLYELKRIKAETQDVKVNIRYHGEISNFKIHEEFLRFIYLHLVYFFRRIFS
mgnify:CR=1 FL=1|tara:strand:- start:1719 stop:2438 length:720 start_codon:yes stop_codon:yes gene_type:complete